MSLSTVSTLVGTGASATGATVTVPGVLRTRNQSKCLWLLVDYGYEEFRKMPVNIENTQTYWKVYVVT